MGAFKKYVSLSLQSALYYKPAFIINNLAPMLLLVGQFSLWTALFSMGGEQIGGYNRSEMYSHLILAFVIQYALTWSSENILSREIRSGTVVSKVIRPVPFLVQNMGEMVGKMLPQLIVNLFLALVAFTFFGHFLITPTLWATLLAFLSFVLGIILRIVFVNCFSLLCFFTTSHLGITWTRQAITEFFSGAMVPILLFPEWLKKITILTPFPLMLQTPISIFMGKELPLPLPLLFALQIGWTVVFLLIHKAVYAKIRKNLTIAGG